MTKAEDAKFELLAQRALPNSKLLGTWELKGGVSAQVTALEIERPDGLTQKMVVRLHGAVDVSRNPHIAEDEYRLLHILQTQGLPTPVPYYVDRFCEIFATPSIVAEYIEGDTEVASLDRTSVVSQLATCLTRVHNITAERVDLSFLPDQETIYAKMLRERPAQLDESLDEGRIRDALEAVWPLKQHNKSVLMHGDYWPGNTLWKDGRLVGIIDWEDAQVGDPLEDLANSRLEILLAFGIEAMHSFTRQYKSMADIDFTNLPYWDLCAALRPAFKLSQWAGDAARERSMRQGHRAFIAQAFEKLAL
jgi:aminoglycoside phosphotransferase (APT) family kinase protein